MIPFTIASALVQAKIAKSLQVLDRLTDVMTFKEKSDSLRHDCVVEGKTTQIVGTNASFTPKR